MKKGGKLEGWKVEKLGDIGKISMCKRIFKDQTTVTGDIPFYKIGTFGKEPDAYISKEIYDEFRNKFSFPKKGDILISASGTIGRRVKYDGEPAYFQDSNIIWIDNDEKQVLNDYLYHFYGACNWNSTKGATISRLYTTNLQQLEIPVPPLPEQQRIVSVLDEAFASIAQAKSNAERNLVNARELYESILEEVFTNSGHDWEDKKLESVCSEITVGHVGSMASKYKPSGIPFLRSQNIRPNSIDLGNVVYIDEQFNSQLKKSQLSPGDVAIVRTGYPGTSAVIPESLPISNCSDLVIVKPGSLVNPYYLCLFFNSTYGKKLVLGNIVGAAQKHFNVTAAKNVLIPVPPLAEQRAIVGRLEALSAETGRLEEIYWQKIESLEELKKSVLSEAFSGEL